MADHYRVRGQALAFRAGTITVTGGSSLNHRPCRDGAVVGTVAVGSSLTIPVSADVWSSGAFTEFDFTVSSMDSSPLLKMVDGNIVGNRVTSVPAGSRVGLEAVDNVVDPDATIMQHFVGYSFYTGTPTGGAGTLQGGSCESHAYASPANMGTVLGFEGIGAADSPNGKTVSAVIGVQGDGRASGTVVVPLLVGVRGLAYTDGGTPSVTEARSIEALEPNIGTTRRSIYSIGAAHFRKGAAANALEIADASDVLQWASDGSALRGFAADGTSARIVLDPGGAAASRLSLSFFNGSTVGIVVNDFGGSGTGNLIDLQKVGATKFAVLSDGSLSVSGTATTATPTAGAASALPATPQGYLALSINGVARKVAYY